MADNVTLTPGSGKTIGTDEVVDSTLGTVQIQIVKLMDGTLDGTTKIAGQTVGGIGSLSTFNNDQYSQYETVAASQTAQVLGSTGAIGDYLAGVLVFPQAAACGVVTILDNATTIGTFPGGGTTALTSLIPFMIPVGVFSTSGAWKITTGANVTCVGIGKFT